MKVYCWSCLWWYSWTGTEKKAFARSIGAYHVSEDVFICSSKDTISGIAVVTGVNNSLRS